MVLWLEEAVVEAAMILCVAVGSVLFILATWSVLADWLRPAKAEDAGQETAASSARTAPGHDPDSRAA